MSFSWLHKSLLLKRDITSHKLFQFIFLKKDANESQRQDEKTEAVAQWLVSADANVNAGQSGDLSR